MKLIIILFIFLLAQQGSHSSSIDDDIQTVVTHGKWMHINIPTRYTRTDYVIKNISPRSYDLRIQLQNVNIQCAFTQIYVKIRDRFGRMIEFGPFCNSLEHQTFTSYHDHITLIARSQFQSTVTMYAFYKLLRSDEIMSTTPRSTTNTSTFPRSATSTKITTDSTTSVSKSTASDTKPITDSPMSSFSSTTSTRMFRHSTTSESMTGASKSTASVTKPVRNNTTVVRRSDSTMSPNTIARTTTFLRSTKVETTGTTDVAPTSVTRCGYDVTATNGSILFSQRNQNTESSDCGRCFWIIGFPPRQVTKLYFKTFNFNPKTYNCIDSLITAKVDESIVGFFCSNMAPNKQELIIKTDQIRIDASIIWKTKDVNDGFELVYESA